jgi:uncharacterized protein (TIGR03437 family)
MSAARKPELDRRLEAYFATLRPSVLREAFKRSAANWQMYAAVTGSAMAMATGASAAIIGSEIRAITPDPAASVLAAKQFLASSNTPLMNAVRLAIARQNSGTKLFNAAGMKANQASPVQAPSISTGGVVPIFGMESIIQPGEWVSIYGTNLASGTAVWNGDFPTSLDGTSVEIDGKAAYLEFVSPGQINLQAPNDTATGTVSVVVTTAGGSATSTVTLSQFSPSFSLLAAQHVAGIIVRSNGSGAYGKGSYDILGPTGSSFGYPTVAAQAGDVVELFGVGFGPTNPAVPAGAAFSGAAPTIDTIGLYINNVMVSPTFVGLSSAGLYQINLTRSTRPRRGRRSHSGLLSAVCKHNRLPCFRYWAPPPLFRELAAVAARPAFFHRRASLLCRRQVSLRSTQERAERAAETAAQPTAEPGEAARRSAGHTSPGCDLTKAGSIRLTSRKVLLAGWDAADWKVIHPLMDAGKMPNVGRLVENGATGQIATLHPPLSPMLWTSIATGKRPFKHGIHGFSEPTPDGRGVQPVTNLSRRSKALWNIFNQNDLRSVVIGWWPSHPAEPIDGVMVSDHYHRASGPLDEGLAAAGECGSSAGTGRNSGWPARASRPADA